MSNWFKKASDVPVAPDADGRAMGIFNRVKAMLNQIENSEADGDEFERERQELMLEAMGEVRDSGYSPLWWLRQFHKKGLAGIPSLHRYDINLTEGEFIDNDLKEYCRDILESKLNPMSGTPEDLEKEALLADLDKLIRSDSEVGWLRQSSFHVFHRYIYDEIKSGKAPEWKDRILEAERREIDSPNYSITRNVTGWGFWFKPIFMRALEEKGSGFRESVRASLRRFLILPSWIQSGSEKGRILNEMSPDLIEGVCKIGFLPTYNSQERDMVVDLIREERAPECFGSIINQYFDELKSALKKHGHEREWKLDGVDFYWKKYRWTGLYETRMIYVLSQYRRQRDLNKEVVER